MSDDLLTEDDSWKERDRPEAVVQTSEAPVPSQPRGAHVVVSYACSVVYGPYDAPRAEDLAEELNKNGWRDEYWLAVPVGRLPGEAAPAPIPSVEQEKQRLWAILDQRQFPEETRADVED